MDVNNNKIQINEIQKMHNILDEINNFHKEILDELNEKNKKIQDLILRIDKTYTVFDYLEATIENMNTRLDEGGQKKQELINNCADVIRRLKDILDTNK